MSEETSPPVPRSPTRRWRPVKARAALVWGLVAFAATQVALVGVFERWAPGVREPQYGRKLTLLKRRLAEAAGRPLVLFMGTSRTLNGVQPAELDHGAADRRDPVVFNFGHAGACPIQQIILLRRLLRQGIHPDHVFLEVLPALLCFDREPDSLVDQHCVCWQDWPAVKRYWPPARSRREWYGENLLPCVSYRQSVMERLFPWALTKKDLFHLEVWSHLDRYGFLGFALGERRLSRAQREKGIARARQEYSYLLKDFHIAPTPDRALRDFLYLCRQRHIGVTLVLMPEGSTYRSWYGAHAGPCLRRYLDGLRCDFGVEAVDARTWIADDDEFGDNHHLLPDGAEDFTRQFGRHNVYQRLLRRWRGGV